ncbi:hypothetical protein QN277_026221 [Acacia crassicarpa]|uniref:Reverse transcriptase domain-containing protein n=1 Tax=Acacia crassicarpa TaxID=499986 RepID=A0AAE1J7E0_9FABA|nr:hypothetical protein QN277_026221 [Acacia crassicarpa]
MNVMIWNSRGIGSKSFPSLVRELKQYYKLDFLAILETRSDMIKTERRIRSLGFNNYSFIAAKGYSGGIWCLWEQGSRKVEVVEQQKQFIHFSVKDVRRKQWFLTVVYASPNRLLRRTLWTDLFRINESIQGPWCIGGDFNATLFATERRSYATSKLSSDPEFCRWADDIQMVDLGFDGPAFTWERGSSEARLDRIFANEAWCTQFMDAKVLHLPWYKSDHRPLLLRMERRLPGEPTQRPFRFIASWVLHDTFNDMVKEEWSCSRDWGANIGSFTQACQRWNKDVFGHTQRRKQQLIRRLDGITREITRGGTTKFLEELQKNPWLELEETLTQDALLWAQKARVNWSVNGDRNTKLFHAQANSRRKRNRIDAICIQEGEWCFEEESIKAHATEYFSNLFKEEVVVRSSLECSTSYPSLLETHQRVCQRDVGEAEIRDALFSMGALKSPGPNGLHALFFQHQWETVKDSDVYFVKQVFLNPERICEVNRTHIVLIPKTDHPETFRDFRPISLCNVIYKIVTKLVANRMKSFMPHVISPNQCSFVPGRHSSDNIIVAQEVVHSMRTMGGKKGYMAIKIDLEKAYDWVNWKFLLKCLHDLNLPTNLIRVVEQCVSTASLQLLWNGNTVEVFNTSRGVRQGDPLSPYLFVICIEKLAHMIQERMATREWKPICLTKIGPLISHLFLADDIILFTEASLQQAEMVRECLAHFCDCSGLKVNASKTQVFFSKNINHNRCTELSTVLGFTQTADLGKYLGVQLHHKRVGKESFQAVVDKVKERLSRWQASSFSLAGRTTLISSVSSAIPAYTMQTSHLPSSVCESLDKQNRAFLWGSIAESWKVPLVAWDEVCMTKQRGGLGLRHAKYHNQAFLMKLGWRLVTHREDLWVKVVRDKYKCGEDFLPHIELKRPGSNVWAGIKKTWDKVSGGIETTNTGNNIRWKWERHGEFTVKSAYRVLSGDMEEQGRSWECLWKVRAPHRCKTLIWLVARQCLLTNANQMRRGLTTDPSCPLCGSDFEDTMHVFRDCAHSRSLWRKVVPPERWRIFCSMSLPDWVRWNVRGQHATSKEWASRFVILCWWLWKRRNLFVFEKKFTCNDNILASTGAMMNCMTLTNDRLAGTRISGAPLTASQER